MVSEKNQAYLAALLFAVIIGFSFLFIKIALPFVSPMDLLAYRFTIAFGVAMIPILLQRENLKLSLADFGRIIPLALLYPIGFFAFQVFGLMELPSSEAGIIQAVAPVFTAVFAAIFLKEFPTMIQMACIFLSVLGIIFISFMSGISTDSLTGAGLFFILFSTACAALYNVFARKIVRTYSVFTLTWVMNFLGFLFFNLFSLSRHLTEGSISKYFSVMTEPVVAVSVLYLGILSSFGTSFLSNFALSKIKATQMSVFNNLATIIAILAGGFFLHETLFYYHFIGALMIIFGVLGMTYFK